ncbi:MULTISPECIES: hypothetical protein [unclassified Nocardia]|uniref:hypothetical protein n=1 Tax=unclassified Nocardia TaxID=2637762 RepID=UPI001CE3F28D|nr:MULTISPECIES: hypothetical protein [unclassified Nocardia]
MTTDTPAAAAADGRAILVTGAGSRLPSGRALTGPVDSIAKLGELIAWCWRTGKLARDDAVPSADGLLLPQIWILGTQACALLDWTAPIPANSAGLPDVQRRTVIRAELAQRVVESLAPLIAAGWSVRGGGGRIRLTRTVDGADIDVEIIVATTVEGVETCTAAQGLTFIDEADAVEFGRRLGRWQAQFGVLPAGTGAATGAAILDRIRRDRLARKQGLVALGAGIVPDIVDDLTTVVQPRWARLVEVDDIDGPDAEYVVELDQDSGELASAGMLTLPVGEPTVHTGAAAAELAGARKRGFAAWRITLTALSGLELPARMPPPDPRMRSDAEVRVWVSTPGLEALLAPAAHGGLGVEVTDLRVDAAVTWAQQGRLLDRWTADLRGGLDAFSAAGDLPLVQLATDASRDYLAQLADPRPWQAEGLAHHLQPVWRAAVCELTRARGRRAMLRIQREFRLDPLTVDDTALAYAIGADQDIADAPGPRGRHELRRRAHLTDDAITALFEAQFTGDPTTVAHVVDVILGRTPLPTPISTDSAAAAVKPENASSSGAASATERPTEPEAANEVVDNCEPEPPAVAVTTAVPAPRRAPAKGKAPSRLSGPAAVLDINGAWLADGTCVALPEELVHAGHLVEFARTLRLGYQVSPSFIESGQIWITDALARRFGIDVDVVDHGSRAEDLRKLTATLPLVTLALAAGWKFGGQREGEEIGLGSWTRVWRDDDDKPTIWIVLLAGMADDPDSPDPDMPILAGDPDPAGLARRLKLFADTLEFPFKVSGPTTGLDLIKEARPKTYGPAEWREKIWAPSTFEAPSGVGILARDFAFTRLPTPEEAACMYCHAYDRGGSYTAGLAGLELPIGDPVHMDEGEWDFDPSVPAYILTRIPPAATWQLPHVLNPAAHDFGDSPQWVCTPQFERALALGYDLPVLETWIWPEHSRILRKWAERYSRAATVLDTDDPDDQAVRKQVKVCRVRGYGMIASTHLIDDDGNPQSPYSREKWFMGVSKSTANIAHFLNTMLEVTGVAILGVDKDTILIASNDPDPVTAWPMAPFDAEALAHNPKHRPSFGRGFGQWKPEASGLMADQIQFFDGGPYKGKHRLTSYADWRTQLAAGAI